MGALALSVGVAAVLAVVLAATSSASKSPTSPSASAAAATPDAAAVKPLAVESPTNQKLTGGKKGGTLTVLNHQDFEHLDPGQAYFSLDYQPVNATQRPLYSYLPNNPTTPVPDMASGQPVISDGGLTVTVHIKHGVHFSPPVNREVTSADVEYAIDRGANPHVGNGYFSAYFGNLKGASTAKGGPFPGVTAPSRYTVVFHLTKKTASYLIGALVLPLSAPVPEEFAKPLDADSPTKYGEYLVATGPYMFKSNSKGYVLGIGYDPGKSATLIRNPNWKASTDFRPAYLDQINYKIGGDPTVIGHQVLDGSSLVQSDPVDNSIVELAYEHYPAQMIVTPGAGVLYISLDNKQGPFTNINLRKAVYAATDREALLKATGGTIAGEVATHFIYPGTSGFTQAGGYAGPKLDYNEYPDGNMTVAEKYMKLAGYPSGKYTGKQTVTIVGSTGNPNAEYGQIVNQTLLNLGFKTKLSLVDQSVMYAKYCGVPKAEIDVCPSGGWIKDFADPETVLYPTFNGNAILPTNSSNFGQVDYPSINNEMAKAALVTGTTARANAWAAIDVNLVKLAVAVPFVFNNEPELESKNVAGVSQQWNQGSWDLSFTSLKG
jgi:peptide/nickel transport system substrate-binding protein